jgi:RNA polymerase sigma factor (sigma-70 family)
MIPAHSAHPHVGEHARVVLPLRKGALRAARGVDERPPPEASAPAGGFHSDQQLVALIRGGQHSAFDTLATRYQTRLLLFCRHMLNCKEDAEDALQEVFTAAFNAMLADERELQVRPWLYRIAKNRCLNQLRRPRPVGVDSMDDHCAENGRTLVEEVVTRQEFRELVGDVQALPDTQRTALLLREIDGFTYEHIATAMDTTVPSVKSLLVRARVGLLDSAAVRDTRSPGGGSARGRQGARPRRGARAVNYQVARAAADAARSTAA